MKKFALLLLAAAGMCASGGGCASPGYSAKDNIQRVGATWRYDAMEAVDDWDHLAMLRPASRMTIWNAQVGH